MIRTDSHIHTSYSSDSDSPMESMILKGIQLGLDSMCFTEHFDPCYPENEDNLNFSLDFDAYEDQFQELKDRYKDKIQLYHGVELGVQPDIAQECQDFYNTYGSRYDFLINSTHIIDHIDPYYGTYFPSFDTPQQAIKHYFEDMWKNLHVFKDYQSLGHLDYICRYEAAPRTPFLYEDYADLLDAILSHIIKYDKALEINTAGWKYGMDHPNPDIQIISRYKELGGKLITIGSDGHKPEHLAYDFHRLCDYLKASGFSSYFFYINKKPHEIKIP